MRVCAHRLGLITRDVCRNRLLMPRALSPARAREMTKQILHADSPTYQFTMELRNCKQIPTWHNVRFMSLIY